MSIRLLLATALLALSACAPPAPVPPTPTASVSRAANAPYAPAAPLNPPVKVTAIDGGIVADVPLYEGIDQGYYAAEGIDLSLADAKVLNVGGLPDAITAMQNKSVENDADPSSVIQSLTAHTLVKDPKLYQVMAVPPLDPHGTMNANTWDPFQDFYVSNGILDRKLDLSQYMDTALVNAALDRLGRE